MEHSHHHAAAGATLVAGVAQVDRSIVPPGIRLPRRYNAATDFIDRHLDEGRGDKLAFRDDTAELTYSGLAERVNRVGSALHALGVEMEQRVLLLLHDSVMFPAAFFGAVKIGAVPVPVSTLLTAADYAYLLHDSRAHVLLVSAALLPRIAPALAHAPFLRHVVVDGVSEDGTDGVSHGAWARHALADLLGAAAPHLAPAPTTSDDVCFWLYTSGSTGQPKAAVHLHSHLVYTAELFAIPTVGIQESDVVFSAARLFFAYGLGNAMTFPLRVGATALLMAERVTPAAVLARLQGGPEQERPTIFGGVPTLYASLLASHGLRKHELRLRRCLSAGEALPRDVGERFRDCTGVDILDGIGSTEMLHMFISNRPGDIRYGSSGKPVPGYQVRIRDDGGQDVAPGEMGDLWVSGPSCAAAYWNQRELSQRTFEGRWMRTGDRYVQTEDGYYVYQGRSDDMLKVGGIYVSPFEVEATLISHPLVLEAAVVGHQDEHGLIKPKAFVVLQKEAVASDLLAEELKAHVKARLALYKYPRWIEFLAELPKTPTGKIQRYKLRQAR